MGGQIQPRQFQVCLWCLFSYQINDVVGTFKLAPFRHQSCGQATCTRAPIIFCNSQASKAVNSGSYDLTLEWNPCVYAVAASEDKCNIGSWVFAKSPIDVRSLLLYIMDTCLSQYFRTELLSVRLSRFCQGLALRS
jgi:hypothetical protein